MAETAPPGNPLSLPQRSRIYCEIIRSGSIACAGVTKHNKATPANTHWRSQCIQKAYHGKYWNFSTTTSVGFWSGFLSLATMYSMNWKNSLPGEGIPDVKTCWKTTGAPACSEEPRMVSKLARPDSQRNECVRVPEGTVKGATFPAM